MLRRIVYKTATNLINLLQIYFHIDRVFAMNCQILGTVRPYSTIHYDKQNIK